VLSKIKPPKDFTLSRFKDFWKLLDRPAVFEAIKKGIIPLLKQKADEIKMMYQFVSAFDGFDRFFNGLSPDEHPSHKVKEFIETRLSSLAETSPRVQKIMGDK
jgi:hypothetical protein